MLDFDNHAQHHAQKNTLVSVVFLVLFIFFTRTRRGLGLAFSKSPSTKVVKSLEGRTDEALFVHPLT